MLPPTTMEDSAVEAAVVRPPEHPVEPNWAKNGMLAIAAIAAASFVLHMIFNNRYGYFRDEFNYIVCGRHLGWGYVDQPPLLPVLSRICLAIFGDSLRSVRLLPALSSAALVLLTGLIARELGGKRSAVALSGLTVLIAPITCPVEACSHRIAISKYCSGWAARISRSSLPNATSRVIGWGSAWWPELACRKSIRLLSLVSRLLSACC